MSLYFLRLFDSRILWDMGSLWRYYEIVKFFQGSWQTPFFWPPCLLEDMCWSWEVGEYFEQSCRGSRHCFKPAWKDIVQAAHTLFTRIRSWHHPGPLGERWDAGTCYHLCSFPNWKERKLLHCALKLMRNWTLSENLTCGCSRHHAARKAMVRVRKATTHTRSSQISLAERYYYRHIRPLRETMTSWYGGDWNGRRGNGGSETIMTAGSQNQLLASAVSKGTLVIICTP